ncbi:hypothetical protein DAEQUDRAFT_703847 [Daedalea quercina L-15889]|uniref:MOSC domain-containing protein n=1 Tax=Daedalea quercina L-15889 TaxID=1314783 RepID=A0A165TGQ7_9APHY|nr:hypothetical protein DAEQUDRAFT_703847 [Daedalea quercina L-15889]
MGSLISFPRYILGRQYPQEYGQEASEISLPELSGYPTSVPFEIGEVRISRICVFPIKSCRGTSLAEARYTPESLEHDRRWGIIDATTHRILTARQVEKMVLIAPRILPDPASPHGGTLEVSFPEESGCESFAVPLNPTPDLLSSWEVIDDGSVNGYARVDGYICQAASTDLPSPSVILSRYFDRPVHLMMKGPEPRACPTISAFPALEASTLYQDAFPLHVASEESLAEFECVLRRLTADQDTAIGGLDRERWTKSSSVLIDRFRPNVIIKGAGVPFAEDFWREVTISPSSESSDERHPAEVTFVMKCTRCLLPNVDPDLGVRDAAVPFKILMKFRTGMYQEGKNKPCFGTYGIFGDSGVLKVGDIVSVKEWTDANGV